MKLLCINQPLRASAGVHYDPCLTAAVKANGTLNCVGCSKRDDRPLKDPDEIFKFLLICAAALAPAAYVEYAEAGSGLPKFYRKAVDVLI